MEDIKDIVNLLNQAGKLDLETIEGVKTRLELLDRAHRKLHELCHKEHLLPLIMAAKLNLKSEISSPKQIRELSQLTLDSEKPSGDLWIQLRTYRPFLKESGRQRLAWEISEVGIELFEIFWSDFLTSFYTLESLKRFKDKPVQDCIGPVQNGKDRMARLISDFLEEIEARREKEWWEKDHAIESLRDELEQLNPPLTWGEIIAHHICYLEAEGNREELKKIDGFFPTERYCFECDKIFQVSKYNPGHFTCPRCSAKKRQRKYRERRKKSRL